MWNYGAASLAGDANGTFANVEMNRLVLIFIIIAQCQCEVEATMYFGQ